MLLWGLLALLQVTILPGFVAFGFLRLKENAIATIIYSFALSLVLNYFLVSALVYAGFYTRPTLVLVIALECAAVGYLQSRPVSVEIETNSPESSEIPKGHWLVAASLFVIGCFFQYVFQAISRPIFEGWDTIFSWNKWAVEWSHGHFPTFTLHYPQLLPVNWSLTYVIAGDEAVQLFARILMPLFSIGSLLMILDLATRTACRAYYIALLILGWLLWYYFDYFIAEGYADIPSSFFGFTAFYLLLNYHSNVGPDWSKRLYLGALFAAGAGLVKQSGLVVPLMYVFLAHFLIFKTQPSIPSAIKWKHLTLYLLLAVVLCGPSYLYQQIQISQNKSASEIAWVTNEIHENRSPLARINHGVGKIVEATKGPLSSAMIVIITVSACLGIAQRLSRILFFVVVLPLFLIWGLFFSYDYRNAALLLPAFAICAGFGISHTANRLIPAFRQARTGWYTPRWLIIFWLLAALVVAVGSILKPSKVFIDQQRINRAQFGHRDLNLFLLDYALHHKIEGVVLSNYRMLHSQPYWTLHARFNPLQSVDSIRKEMNEHDRQYLLQYGAVSPEVTAYIDSEVKQGSFEIVAQSQILLLIRKNRDRPMQRDQKP